MSVKQIMDILLKQSWNKRWWWSLVEKWDPSECDFIWTQWLRPHITEAIKQKYNANLNNDLNQTPIQYGYYSLVNNSNFIESKVL